MKGSPNHPFADKSVHQTVNEWRPFMIKKDHEIKKRPPTNNTTNNNKNDVKVNNQFSLTINLGGSLNLLALIAGVYLVRRIVRKKGEK